MGYIYAFSNESMPGLIKIGMTERTPEERLAEANSYDTFKPPTPYIMEIQKKVNNCKEIEKKIHALLSDKRVNPHREFFKITIEELKELFNSIEGEGENQIVLTVLEKEKELINKVNNDIFDVLSNFKINVIYFNESSIKINHEKKEYEYEYHSSNNLVHIINIILSVESHIFGDDMLEYYVSHYIRKNEGCVVYCNDIQRHFPHWSVNFTPMDKYQKYYIKNKNYNYTYFVKLKSYLSEIHKYDSVKQRWIDIEFLENARVIDEYKTKYNILEHYTENLNTLIQLKKDCTLKIGNNTFSLHKYMESKVKN